MRGNPSYHQYYISFHFSCTTILWLNMHTDRQTMSGGGGEREKGKWKELTLRMVISFCLMLVNFPGMFFSRICLTATGSPVYEFMTKLDSEVREKRRETNRYFPPPMSLTINTKSSQKRPVQTTKWPPPQLWTLTQQVCRCFLTRRT